MGTYGDTTRERARPIAASLGTELWLMARLRVRLAASASLLPRTSFSVGALVRVYMLSFPGPPEWMVERGGAVERPLSAEDRSGARLEEGVEPAAAVLESSATVLDWGEPWRVELEWSDIGRCVRQEDTLQLP